MSYLLDSNVIFELVRPKPAKAVLAWFENIPSEALHISVLTLGEIRQGVELKADSARREMLRLWLAHELLDFGPRILAVDIMVADRWGRLIAQVGHPVPSIDSLLAATALPHELRLVTRNQKDFNYPGLEVINPWGSSAWDWRYLVMLLLLLSINFHLGRLLARRPSVAWLSGGIALNLLVLGYFKYADFFIGNLNAVAGTQYPLLRVILPLGISFFIFQKIAYLVDCHKGLVTDRDPLRFAIFVMFFPQLIAGPIVHHAQIIPQLQKDRLLPDARRVSAGLFLLAVGLFKKVVIADWLGEYVNEPFAHVAELQFLDAWTAALAYSLQLYFDFSAYSEMAMGLALLFGIILPVNFNSPYKAASIAEFWRRWHITLGRFLRDYLYIPLGGNKHGQSRAVLAALTVMVLGGLWHGAGWTFVVWGAMHGVYLAAHRVWKLSGRFTLPQPLGMAITFLVVLFAWVMFRAASVADAITIWKTMLGMNGVMLPSTYLAWLDGSCLKFQQSSFINGIEVWGMACLLAFAMYAKNTHEALAIFISTAPSRRSAFYVSAMIVVYVLALGRPTTFLYFQF